MKWLGFIILVLIESLAIFGLSLEQIGFTVPQAILISFYVVLLIITITGFIIAHFVNLQKERENEFRILVEKLRGQEEAIKTVKEQVFRIGQNVLISEEKQGQEERSQENKKRILSSFFMKQVSLTEESLECPFLSIGSGFNQSKAFPPQSSAGLSRFFRGILRPRLSQKIAVFPLAFRLIHGFIRRVVQLIVSCAVQRRGSNSNADRERSGFFNRKPV